LRILSHDTQARYSFNPAVQYDFETLLVDAWEQIAEMILAKWHRQQNSRAPAVRFADYDVQNTVRCAVEKMLGLCGMSMPCTSPDDFVDAILWFLEHKELSLLREHVCGSTTSSITKVISARANRDDPIEIQLVLGLPDSARGWWYSKNMLVGEFGRRGLSVTGDELALLFASENRALISSKGMSRRRSGDDTFLWVPISTGADIHSLAGQQSGSIVRAQAYNQEQGAPLRRTLISNWNSQKESQCSAPLSTESTGSTAAPMVLSPPSYEDVLREICLIDYSSLSNGPWCMVKPNENSVLFCVPSQSYTERSVHFEVGDSGDLVVSVRLRGRVVPQNVLREMGLEVTVKSAEDAKRTLATAAAFNSCPGFVQDRRDEARASAFRRLVGHAQAFATIFTNAKRPFEFPQVGIIRKRQKTRKDVAPHSASECDSNRASISDERSSGAALGTDEDDVDDTPPPQFNENDMLQQNERVRWYESEAEKIDVGFFLDQNGTDFTFRDVNCRIATDAQARCASCDSRRGTFNGALNHVSHTQDLSNYARRDSLFQSPHRVQQLAKEQSGTIKLQKQQINRLRDAAARHRNEHGIVMDHKEDSDLMARIFHLTDEEAKKQYPEGSSMRVMWEDQIKHIKDAETGKRPRVKYNPLTMQMAIRFLSKMGTQQYEEFRKYFNFPTARAVRNHTRTDSSHESGIMHHVLDGLVSQAKERGMRTMWQRCGLISFDAMSIRGGVYFNKQSGRIVGFAATNTSEDAVKSALEAQLSSSLEDTAGEQTTASNKQPEVASHYLVFYYTSLGASDFSFPVARYALKSINHNSLSDYFNDVVLALEARNFHVVAAVFDGASENRTFMQKLATMPVSDFIPKNSTRFKFDKSMKIAMLHPVWGKALPIFLISDPPHCWKKICNALEYSANPQHARDLQMADAEAILRPLNLGMIQSAAVRHTGPSTTSAVQSEFALTRGKLTNAHFKKDAFTRMRVSLAVQVMSNSVVNMLKKYSADRNEAHIFQPLIEFCFQMNRFVDICNGRPAGDRLSPDDAYGNIHSTEDKALDHLGEVMQFFENWHSSLEKNSHLKENQKKNYFLPEQCYYDLQSICKGLICMSLFYLDKFGSNIEIVQRRLMQDRVENHFSNVRQFAGGGTRQPRQEAVFRATDRAANVRLNRQPIEMAISNQPVQGSNCQDAPPEI